MRSEIETREISIRKEPNGAELWLGGERRKTEEVKQLHNIGH